ncbi:hypothetical protein HMI55_002475 [Coelomomyces lativittatus]|nr:hypothetical protein HMI55_002475 [Coelomomyces lativittatus]
MSVFVFMSFQLFASWERKKNFFQFHSIYINENPKIQFGDKEITLYNSTSELRNTDTEQVLELKKMFLSDSSLILSFQLAQVYAVFNSCSVSLKPISDTSKEYIIFQCFFPTCEEKNNLFFVDGFLNSASIQNLIGQPLTLSVACRLPNVQETIPQMDYFYHARIKIKNPNKMPLNHFLIKFETWDSLLPEMKGSSFAYVYFFLVLYLSLKKKIIIII